MSAFGAFVVIALLGPERYCLIVRCSDRAIRCLELAKHSSQCRSFVPGPRAANLVLPRATRPPYQYTTVTPPRYDTTVIANP
jgi:hypothetical protein